MFQKADLGDVQNPNDDIVLAAYTYGATAGAIGMRTAMTDQSGSTSWAYGNYGRSVTEIKTITGETKQTSTTSDWLGRVLTIQYPDNETLTYQYDALGRARNFSSNSDPGNPLAVLAYNALSQITTTTLKNNIVVGNIYNSNTNRLVERKAGVPNNPNLLDFSYLYDQSGNIKSITDSVLDETHSYQYDPLNRLVSAESAQGQDHAYRQTFSYDQIGNIMAVANWQSSDVIFKDDFESGSFASWSGGVTDAQDIWTVDSPSTPAASGRRFVVVDANDTDPVYLQDNTPANETQYRARFYVSPGGLTMATGDVVNILTGYNSSSMTDFAMQLQNAGGVYQVRAGAQDNSNVWSFTNWYTLSNYWSALEIDYQAESTGSLTLWVDGIQKQSLPGINNDLRTVRTVQLGVSAWTMGAGTHGQILFDAFESRRLTYIGLLSQPIANTSNGMDSLASYHLPLFQSLDTDTPTPTLADTSTSTPTPSITPTPSRTLIPTNSATPTSTPTPSSTPSRTPTPTITRTPTRTPTATYTSTYTKTATLVTYTPTYTKTPTPTLVGWWSFDETTGTPGLDATNDSISSNGSPIGARIQAGFWVHSLQFNSATQYFNVPRTLELEPVNGFTLSLWVYPLQINSGSTYVIANKGGTAQDYRLYINSAGYLIFHMQDNRETDVTPTVTLTPPANTADLLGPKLPVNTWTHIAAAYDPANQMTKLYLNGTLIASKRVTGTIVWNTAAGLTLGDATNSFIGMLDEVGVFGAALSDAQIQDLANLQITATPNPTYTATNATPSNTPTSSRTPTPTSTFTPTRTPTPFTLTPTSTFTPGIPDPRWGTGTDGNLTVASGTTFNINTQNSNGRTCADGGDAVAYNVTTFGSTMASLSTMPSPSCLSPGDEILLINLQGTTASIANTGLYEFLKVASVSGNTVTFATSKINWYGDGWRSDSGIGTGSSQQRVMLQRVPNYQNVTVDGTLTSNHWDGNKYGVIAIRIQGALTGSGIISSAGSGYGGGAAGLLFTRNNGELAAGGGSMGYGINGPSLTGGGAGGIGDDVGDAGSMGVYALPSGSSRPYGSPPLDTLYLGSGGGGGGAFINVFTGVTADGRGGGRGGGIIALYVQSINFAGTIKSDGELGGHLSGKGGDGGTGSGGSLRIESNAISAANLSAAGGGDGRIAVYVPENVTAVYSSAPFPYTGAFGQGPTATPTPTAINFSSTNPYGTGLDGDLTVNSGATYNLNTQYSGGRTCADGVAYSVTQLDASWAKVESAPASTCLAIGDEVMLINMHGSSTNYGNVGNYEFLRIGGIVSDTIYFTTAKINHYGAGASDDALSGQNVVLMRVPNYNNVTINGSLTASVWNGSKYGVIAFRVHGLLSGSGTITAAVLGFGGGAGGVNYTSGGVIHENHGSPGGGIGPSRTGGGNGGENRLSGGGGGYGIQGSGSGGGYAYGSALLERLYLGSGGGGGGSFYNSTTGVESDGGSGGRGGGAIILMAHSINFSGTIKSQGGAGIDPGKGGSGGGGSGGSIRVEGDDVSLNTVSVIGGSSTGYLGGRGRIAVYYQASFVGNFTPHYLQKKDTTDSIFQDDFEMGDLSQWSASVTNNGNLSVSPALTYWGLGGLQAVINDNNDEYVENAMPQAETQYRARVYLNPFGVSMGATDTLDLLDGINGTDTVFKIQLQEASTGTFKVRAGMLDNGTTWRYTNWYSINANAWNAVEISYQAFDNDGGITLWLNGASQQSLTKIDNSTRAVTSVRLGAQGIVATTRGSLYFDNFESRRFSSIGTLPGPDVDPPQLAVQPGWVGRQYAYAASHAHAVTSLTQDSDQAVVGSYEYDAVGNMTTRFESGVTWTQTFNAENRLASISNSTDTWTFTYDGDGNRVKQTNPDGTVTLFLFGGLFEVRNPGVNEEVTKYYVIAGQRVAMDENGTLSYLLTDHLGSVVAITDASGSLLSEQRFMPFGEPRLGASAPTDFSYTGQRALAGTGLMDYNARFYDAALGRFVSADTVVPGAGNPQAFNRYAYVVNNPMRLVDPSGHGYLDCESLYSCDEDESVDFTIPIVQIGGGGGGGGGGETCDFAGNLSVLCIDNPFKGKTEAIAKDLNELEKESGICFRRSYEMQGLTMGVVWIETDCSQMWRYGTTTLDYHGNIIPFAALAVDVIGIVGDVISFSTLEPGPAIAAAAVEAGWAGIRAYNWRYGGSTIEAVQLLEQQKASDLAAEFPFAGSGASAWGIVYDVEEIYMQSEVVPTWIEFDSKGRLH